MHVYMIVIIIWPKKLYTTHTHTQELATTTNNKEKITRIFILYHEFALICKPDKKSWTTKKMKIKYYKMKQKHS